MTDIAGLMQQAKKMQEQMQKHRKNLPIWSVLVRLVQG